MTGTESDWLAAAFEQQRGHLRAVAYRLLGSVSDADDAVQEAWIRLSGASPGDIDNLSSWLTTVVARVSLNMLRSRRNRPEQLVGDSWSPAAEAAGRADEAPSDPADEAVLADSVGLALLVVLDTLTPAERLAFVLHDLFAMSFDEVAAVLGRSAQASRQLASRARRRVRGAEGPVRGANLARQRAVAAAFLAASRGGDFAALVALLDSEVVLTADAYAAHAEAPVQLRGADRVASAARLASGRAEHSQLALIDGAVGVVYAPGGKLRSVLTFSVGIAGKITAIDMIADPARLRRLRLAVLPAALPAPR